MAYGGPVAIDYGSASRTECSAGIAPPSLGAEAAPSVAIEQLPTVALQLSTPSTSLLMRYQQRWYLREPNLSGRAPPLLYHYLIANYAKALTPRLALTAGITAGYGTLDYTSFVSYTLPTTTTSVPAVAFMQIATGTAEVGMRYQATPRLMLGAGASGYRREPFNEQVAMRGLGQAQSFSLTGNALYGLTERTGATAFLSGTQSEVAQRPPIRSAMTQAGINHQFTPTSRGSVAAGVTLFFPEGSQAALFPSATASLTNVTGTGRRPITWTATLGYAAYVDTMLGRVRANATLSGDAMVQLGARWTAHATIGGAVPTTSQPVGIRMPETYAQAGITFARQIGNRAELYTGTRHSFRMTHPNASPFAVVDRQSWVFVGLTLWLATSDGTNGRWVL